MITSFKLCLCKGRLQADWELIRKWVQASLEALPTSLPSCCDFQSSQTLRPYPGARMPSCPSGRHVTWSGLTVLPSFPHHRSLFTRLEALFSAKEELLKNLLLLRNIFTPGPGWGVNLQWLCTFPRPQSVLHIQHLAWDAVLDQHKNLINHCNHFILFQFRDEERFLSLSRVIYLLSGPARILREVVGLQSSGLSFYHDALLAVA